MPGKLNSQETDEAMKLAPATWRDDSAFLEFCTYKGVGTALWDPTSSGYNLVGAGGREIDTDARFNEAVVMFAVVKIDDGEEFSMNLTPESARNFAEKLNDWADDADNASKSANIERKMEAQRRKYYANGGH